ncbi:MAG TPA: serine hydrolase [Verrucomicrobiae bacterium]|nr:serine hydrolase [Verrucomicrobiae bacterium]
MNPRSLRWNTSALALGLGLVLLAAASVSAQTVVYTGVKPDEFMKRWLVLGPIPVSEDAAPDEAAQKKAFAGDALSAAGGETRVSPRAGARVIIGGKDYEWRQVESTNDIVDLKVAKTPEAFSIAYAWAEIEIPEKTKALLGIGSDDGVKAWLNGKLIHENWIGRAPQPDDDVVPVEFSKGRNQLLLKIQNMEGPWGFACRLPGPESQAKKLIAASRNGDLEAATLLLDRGVDINGRSPAGLTALQAAKLRGQKEMAGFLVGKGADAHAPVPPPEKLVDSLFSGVVKSGSAGAVVLVAQNGRVLFEKGYGLADTEKRATATPETKFRIGSITKQFTAAAILKLQEEGKLSVNDKLSKFIPDYPRGDEVTIHHLLTHTSGIHSYTSKPDFMESVTAPVKTEEHIQSFKNDPYDFDPGKRWLYNNSGYFLLGYIIEKASGESYGDFLRRKFFEPLGMTHTGVHSSSAALEHEALGYQFEDGKFRKALNWDMSKAGGAGALYSTVGDLHRWNEGVFNGNVLQEPTLKAAFTPVKTEDNKDDRSENGYGYGWAIGTTRGLQEISHGGGLHGFLSYLLRLPKENFTVVVLANCSPPPPGVDPGGLAHEVAELYLGEKLAPRETPKLDTKVAPKAFDAVTGRYDYGGAILTVTREGDKVFAQLSGQPKFEIFPKSETNFFWKVVEAEVTFVKNEKAEVTGAIHKQGGQTINAPKLGDVKTVKVDSKVYDAYTGKYDYGQGKAIMNITREGERLFAQLTGQPKFEIFPKSETEFFWKVINAQVTFVKNQDGQVTKAIHEQSGNRFDAPRME